MTTTDPQPHLSDQSPQADSPESKGLKAFHLLDIEKYGIATTQVKKYARLINEAITKNQFEPRFGEEQMQFARFMAIIESASKTGSKISKEDLQFLYSALPSYRPEGPDETDEDLDWAEEIRQRNKLDGSGFTYGEVSGRTTRRYSEIGSKAVKPKRRPPGSVTPILESRDPHLPQLGVWSDENARRMRDILLPGSKTREERLRQGLEGRENERLARITAIHAPETDSDAARELMGMYERQEEGSDPEALIEGWTEYDRKDLQTVGLRHKFYPKDRAELQFVLSHVDRHLRPVPAWQKLDALTDTMMYSDKEEQKRLMLDIVNKYDALETDGIMDVRYADDLLDQIKQLKEFGLEPDSTFPDLFPPEDIEREELKADQLVRVAGFHEADMIVKGTPVVEAEDAESAPQYVTRVLGSMSPSELIEVLGDFSSAGKNKFEFALAKLQEAQGHGLVRDDVRKAIEIGMNQVFWGR